MSNDTFGMNRSRYDYSSSPKAMTPCPLCRGESFEPLASIDRYGMGVSTVGCRSCGLIQTNPRLTSGALQEFYQQNYREFYEGIKTPTDTYVHANKKHVRLAEVVRFLREQGALETDTCVLDVGCSEGAFFAALRASGHKGRLVGVEPNVEFGSFAMERYGAELYSSDAELPDNLYGSVGLIVLNHVLEHLQDPVAALNRFRQFLAPKGHLYVDVPDAHRYRGVNDLHIAHIFHFGQKTLTTTLASANFEVARLEPYEPVNHPPSIRALARAAVDGAAPEPRQGVGDAANREGWIEVRQIHGQRHILRLRRLLRRVPLLAAAYRRARRAAVR